MTAGTGQRPGGALRAVPDVDAALAGALEEVPRESRWLVLQTALGGAQRRALVELLEPHLGRRVLDLGAGFGALAIEAALRASRDVLGVDRDAGCLRSARRIGERVEASDWPPWRPRPAWSVADAGALPLASRSVDSVVARLVFQHLPPRKRRDALREAARVLVPGGRCCVVDVDDQLELSWPPPSAPLATLSHALRRAQEWRGGDRGVGRKMPAEMSAAGFEVLEVRLVGQAGYGQESPFARAMLLERFSHARADVLASGALDPRGFDAALGALASAPAEPAMAATAQLLVVGRRPR